MKRILVNFPLWLLLSDALTIIFAWLLAFYVRIVATGLAVPITWRYFLLATILLVPVWLVTFASLGLYSRPVYERRIKEFGRLFLGSFLVVVLMIAADFMLVLDLFTSRLLVFYGWFFILISLILTRLTLRFLRLYLFRFSIGVERLLLVGNASQLENILPGILQPASRGHELVAVVSPDLDNNLPSSVRHYRTLQQVPFKHLRLNTIVVADPGLKPQTKRFIASKALSNYLNLRLALTDDDVLQSSSQLEIFQGLPVLLLTPTTITGWGRVTKRLFDLTVATFLMILTAPILIFAMLFIKLSDRKSPVIFKQHRLTKFEKQVYIYKLRTMKGQYSNTPARQVFEELGRPDLINLIDQGYTQVPDDPRVTKFGRWLRQTSIDELPQLINVIRGQISLVGPRALTRQELNDYEEYIPILLSIKTGMTGLAQVNGRGELSMSEKIRFNIYYVQHWSIWLDLSIVLKTIIKVLSREKITKT